MSHTQTMTYTLTDFETGGLGEPSWTLGLLLSCKFAAYDPGHVGGTVEQDYAPEGGELEEMLVSVEHACCGDADATEEQLKWLQAILDKKLAEDTLLYSELTEYADEHWEEPEYEPLSDDYM